MPTPFIYIMAGMLFLGAAPLPYGYYILLRLLASGFFIWAAIITHQNQGKVLPWIFGFLALLFNPIIKIHLPKELWIVIDISTAFFVLAIKSKISLSDTDDHIKTVVTSFINIISGLVFFGLMVAGMLANRNIIDGSPWIYLILALIFGIPILIWIIKDEKRNKKATAALYIVVVVKYFRTS